MYKKALRLILVVLLLLVLSCSTFSPFMRNRNYSTLPLVFDKDNTTVAIVSLKDEKICSFVLSYFREAEEFIKRSDFLTVAFFEDGTIMGAFEGYYPIDGVRLASGKNTIDYGVFNVYSPDGGIVAFTTGDVKVSKELMFENRAEKVMSADIEKYYSYPLSIYGTPTEAFNIWFASLLGFDKTYMDFNKIDISFSFTESLSNISNEIGLFVNGSLDFNNGEDATKFARGIKASLVGQYRQKRLSFDVKSLENKLKQSNSRLEFQDFPYHFSYTPLEYQE